MTTREPDTDEPLDRAASDDGARQQLLARHRARLRRMVAIRLDRRVATRIDPSDVVQKALAEAAQKLPDYLRRRPVPFYPWLRGLSWERLMKLRHRHVAARRPLARQIMSGETANQVSWALDRQGYNVAWELVRPGVGDGNWAWRATDDLPIRAGLERLAGLTELFARRPKEAI